MGKTLWMLRLLLRRIWVRTVSIGLLGFVAALAGVFLAPVIPDVFADKIGTDAVDRILGILATSMLVVVTFSLSVAVQAYATAAQTATPRASQLLQEDHTTQNVLSTFLGAFLFSLVGIIALSSGAYEGKGRVVLFGATIAVVALVVIALMRWIAHLMDFGRLSDTLARVEKAATNALAARSRDPYLGGRPLVESVPESTASVFPDTIGYVQHVDIEALSICADEIEARFWLADLPGCFVHPANALLYVSDAALSDELTERIRATFTIAPMRSFDQDPRFGLIVMAEIASRALSPAVNDPGTAIDVLSRLVRILSGWNGNAKSEPRFERVYVPPIRASELLEDAFQSIARDGAALIEVQIRLQKALAALAGSAPDAFYRAARDMSVEAKERAEMVLTSKSDKQRLEKTIRGVSPCLENAPAD